MSNRQAAPPITRPRLDSLTGLRAIAAGAVLLTHIAGLLGGSVKAAEQWVARPGAIGVTFFFALSGFVLTWSARPGDSSVAFWRRRFARIYPSYLVALIAGIVVTKWVEHHSIPAGPAAATITLIQAWWHDEHYYFALNGVSWTLSCEAFFYLLFPLVIGTLRKAGRVRRRQVQVVCLAMIVGLAVLGLNNSTASWAVDHFPPARILDFVLGCTVALDVIRGEWPFVRLRLPHALILGAVVYLVAGAPVVASFRNVALPIIPILLILGAAACADVGGTSGILASPTFVWLGDISYCFYLVHQLVIKVTALEVARRFELPGGGLPYAAAAVVVAVGVAWTLHRFVEIPAERWLRGSSRRGSPVTLANHS